MEVDEEAVRRVLGRDVLEVKLEAQPPLVRFSTHAAALEAKEAGAWAELCAGVDTQYNERVYDGRGWCGHTLGCPVPLQASAFPPRPRAPCG